MEQESLEFVAQTAEELAESQTEILDAFILHLSEAPELQQDAETHKYQAIMPTEDTNVEQALSNLKSLHRNTSISDVISNFRRYASRTLDREQTMLTRLSALEPVATAQEDDDFI